MTAEMWVDELSTPLSRTAACTLLPANCSKSRAHHGIAEKQDLAVLEHIPGGASMERGCGSGQGRDGEASGQSHRARNWRAIAGTMLSLVLVVSIQPI
jgi:hypothetical protein